MSAPLLRVRRLTVDLRARAGRRRLIDDVSFDLAPGEILGLVGESGAGKSLLTRSLVRLLPPHLHIAAARAHCSSLTVRSTTRGPGVFRRSSREMVDG